MPQINLLTNSEKPKSLPVQKLLTGLARLFALAFIAVIAYYGYVYYRSRSVVSKILAKQSTIVQMQNEVLNNPSRNELLTRQGQLQELAKLVNDHPYWSKLFPELARVTLKSAYYTTFTADVAGKARMTVIVPTYTEFDAFLQVFDKSFSDQFSDVKVISVSKYQVAGATGVRFEVELTYKKDFIKKTTEGLKTE